MEMKALVPTDESVADIRPYPHLHLSSGPSCGLPSAVPSCCGCVCPHSQLQNHSVPRTDSRHRQGSEQCRQLDQSIFERLHRAAKQECHLQCRCKLAQRSVEAPRTTLLL